MRLRMVAVSSDHRRFLDYVGRLINWNQHAGPLFERKGGDAIRRLFQRNFEREGYPEAWKPLAPRTIAERRELGYGGQHMILQRSRELKRSVVERGHPHHVSQLSSRGRNQLVLTLSSSDPRFRELHKGNPQRNLPARPMTVIGTSDFATVDKALSFTFDQIFGRR